MSFKLYVIELPSVNI